MKLVNKRTTLNPTFKMVQRLPHVPRIQPPGHGSGPAAALAASIQSETQKLAPLPGMPFGTIANAMPNSFCSQVCE